MQFMLNRMFAGVAMWVLVLAVPLQAQKIAYDPDADLLGRPQKEYLGEMFQWYVGSRNQQHLTFERVFENQKGPVLFLGFESFDVGEITPENVRIMPPLEVPAGAPIASPYGFGFGWDKPSNCGAARRAFRGIDYGVNRSPYVLVNGERFDIDFQREVYEFETTIVNHEPSLNIPVGTDEFCVVGPLVLIEPLAPGRHFLEYGQDNPAGAVRYTIDVVEPALQDLHVGEVYSQGFDSLGTDGEAVEQPLPFAWTVTDEWAFALHRDTDAEFPIGSRPRPGAFPYVTNAGLPGEEDRALSIYMPRDTESRSLESDVSQIQFLASASGNADSLQIQFDIEAWDASSSSRAADPGEAAFDVTVDLDSGNGFEPFLDLGKVTTGELQKPEGEYLNGNDPANRVSFDSGILQAAIPDGSQLRFRWAASLDGKSDGWVFGLDDVQVSLFRDSESIFGDFDESGTFGPADIDLLSVAVRDGIDDLAFDTNGDGRVGTEDYDSLLDQANVLLGDADISSAVDFSDFLALSSNFGQAGGWAAGDFDGNGEVAFSDFLILSENFGSSTLGVAAVPEPNSACLFGLGLLVSNALRRKRA